MTAKRKNVETKVRVASAPSIFDDSLREEIPPEMMELLGTLGPAAPQAAPEDDRRRGRGARRYEHLSPSEIAALDVSDPAQRLEIAIGYLQRAYTRRATQLDAFWDGSTPEFEDLSRCLAQGKHQIRSLTSYILGLPFRHEDNAFRAKLRYEADLVVKTLVDHYNIASGILERAIKSESQEEPAVPPVDPRWKQLEEFVKRHGWDGFAAYGQQLFPEVRPSPTAALPQTAPATWRDDKQPGETPPAFVKRFYGEWLGNGLTRASIRHLDLPLYTALDNWLRKNKMPADIDLPTLKEQNTRWVERLEREGLAAVVPEGSAAEVIRASRRLQSAKQRRGLL